MFGKRLNEARHARGYTAQQMADYLGIGLRTYRFYESGRTEPSLRTLVKMADYLAVTKDYLLCRGEKEDGEA